MSASRGERRGRKRKPTEPKTDDNSNNKTETSIERPSASVGHNQTMDHVIWCATRAYGSQFLLRFYKAERDNIASWGCNFCDCKKDRPCHTWICAQNCSMSELAPYVWNDDESRNSSPIRYEWLCDLCSDNLKNSIEHWVREHPPYNAEAIRWLLVAINIVATLDLSNLIVSYLSR
jgi:hypothetical protein